jgi:NAD(P)-dependent dehydrogenase (short-subunit alcohol dehydrogenase family)
MSQDKNFVSTSGLLSQNGQRVLITGAASGIGKAMTLRFADAGADCLLLDIDAPGLQSMASELQSKGSRVSIAKVDLRSKSQIDAFWAELTDEGLPDVVINNAGVYALKDYLEIDEPFWDTTLSINLESVFWMCQNFIKRRLRKGGIIVNVSTIEAILPFKKDLVAYGTSKAGVIGLTRGLARDYGPYGFRINAILPGAIKTPSTRRLMKMAIQRFKVDLIKTGYDFQSRLAMGRWGEPDEVARVALFLASDLASYVQGAVIPVDGGFLSS